MVAVLDTLDLKMSARNAIAGLLIPLEDGEVRQSLINSGHLDGAAAVHRSLIHMGNDRLRQDSVGFRDGNLNEGVHTLGHVGNGDDTITARFFCCDDLSVLDNVKYRTGERVIGLIKLQQFQLDFGVVLEDQRDIRLAIPMEFLPHLAGVRTDGVPGGRSNLSCHIRANGHRVPGYVCQIAAQSGGVGTHETVVYALNFDDRTGKAL